MDNPVPTTPTPIVVTPIPIVQNRDYDFRTLDDIVKTDNVRALLYSPPKHGKTALVGTFPAPAILDFDGEGVKVFKSKWWLEHYPKKNDIIHKQFDLELDQYGVPKNADPFWKAIDWLNKVVNDPRVETVSPDSLTALSRVARIAGLIAAGKKNRSKTWTEKDQSHLLLLTQADFGAEMNAVEQLLDQLMQVRGKNIVVTAHERTETNDTGMVTARTPMITGDRLRGSIARWFDEVWYLDTDAAAKRILITAPIGVLKGVGSRLGVPRIEDPSYEKIMQSIK